MILDKIVADTRIRLEEEKKRTAPAEMEKRARDMEKKTGFPFRKELEKEGLTFICEVKKASPSKGLIAPDFPYLEIAREYEKAGAGAISVLTEPHFFQGSPEYLEEIRKEVSVPLLRKDFIVDPYQICQAKVIGADAVLLIASVLEGEQIGEFQQLAEELGLSALVEIHDEEELEQAVKAGAKILGVNNRNLKDFTVDIGTTLRLLQEIPEGTPLVAESGIRTREDIRVLEKAGVNGVLIGETLMRSADKKAALLNLKGDRE